MFRMFPSPSAIMAEVGKLIACEYRFDSLSARDSLAINDFAYYPSAYGKQADEIFYLNLRSRILEIASQAQELDEFDSSVSSANAFTRFDQILYREILDLVPISLYEASKPSVWSYLTLRVLPDVANWRYPNRTKDSSYERHTGQPRDVFRRIWTRSFFSGDEKGLLQSMGEDQAVSIFERTGVVSNPKNAISALRALATVRKISLNNEIYRDAMTRVRRIAALESLDALPQDIVDSIVLEAFVESLSVIAPNSVVK
jgi:hypothetical protein